MSVERENGSVCVGVIGAGRRTRSYFRNIPADVAGRVAVSAVADPDPAARTDFIDWVASPAGPARQYSDSTELLNKADALDAVVITSPNDRHVDDAVQALDAGLAILLEKPVATTAKDCARLWSAYTQATDPRLMVGFVLRYTPFFSTVREIIRSGRLGEVLSVDATESVGTKVTMGLHRGWRPDAARSGGFMVEKCCHDFDVLSWLMDRDISTIYSMAARTHFRPRPQHERLHKLEDLVGQDPPSGPQWRSPYDSDSSFPDHQTALLDFGDGLTGTFTACMAQPRSDRGLHIFGTEGALVGNIADSRIEIRHAAGTDGRSAEIIDVQAGPSGHNGGDEVLGDAFWHLAAGRGGGSRAGLEEGIGAVLAALATQESSTNSRPVDVGQLRSTTFGG